MSGRHKILDVTPAEAVELHKAGALIVDVREDDEWAAGHAPQAVHVPLGQISEIKHLRSQQVLTVCRSGTRSAQAAKALADGGTAVGNIVGGMSAWAAAGLPVVTDDASPGSVI